MKRHFYTLISILFLLGTAISGRAQQVQVEASLHQVSIKIGEQTTLHLIAHIPAKSAIIFPALADSIGKIQIVNIAKPDTVIDKNNSGQETITQNYTVTGFDAGSYKIPIYTFRTPTASYTTDSLLLEVTTVPVDTTKSIYDIKQPFAVSYTFWDWLKDNWPWVAIPLALILIAIGIVYYLKHRPKKEVVKEKEIILPDYAIALNKLYALRDKKLWQQNEVKQYHIELTDTIREYLEKRYRIQAHEQTTDEIFAGLKYKDIQEANLARLRQILTLADLVKFAKEKPEAAENELSLDNAIDFIEQTKPVVAPPVIPVIKEDLPK